MKLNYSPLETIEVNPTASRIDYILKNVKNKNILDIGCYDETALIKKGTNFWLHEELSKQAKYVLGIDSSSKIPEQGLYINEQSKIIRACASKIESLDLDNYQVDAIVAGELIEHLPHSLDFFKQIKNKFSGKELICTTPNATSMTNTLIGLFKKESTHHDHLQLYSYKTLNTLCLRSNFSDWEIIPYYVRFTEMILEARGFKKQAVKIFEKTINFIEKLFPLLSGGLILHVKEI